MRSQPGCYEENNSLVMWLPKHRCVGNDGFSRYDLTEGTPGAELPRLSSDGALAASSSRNITLAFWSLSSN